MYKKFAIFGFLFFLVILQVSVLPLFFNAHRIPDLVLIALIFFTIKRGFGSVWKMAIVGGLILDLFSFFPIGVDIFSFVTVSLLTGFLAQRFFITHSNWKFLILIALVMIGTAANDFIVSILIKMFLDATKIESAGFPIFSSDLWSKLLNNGVLFILIYWPLKKLENLKNIYPYNQRLVVRRPA